MVKKHGKQEDVIDIKRLQSNIMMARITEYDVICEDLQYGKNCKQRISSVIVIPCLHTKLCIRCGYESMLKRKCTICKERCDQVIKRV